MMKPNNELQQSSWKCIILTIGLYFLFSTCANNLNAQSHFKNYQLATKNWNHLYQAGSFDKALEQGELAYKFASKGTNKTHKATALQLQAKALMKITKRQSKNRAKANELLKQSLVLLGNVGDSRMKKENLQLLKEIAQIEKNSSEVLLYEQKIRDINNDVALKVEKRALEAQKAKLEKNTSLLKNKLHNLSDNVEVLETQKVETESRLEAQLQVSDSLISKLALDSLLLAQKEMMLSEKNAKLELQQSMIDLQASQKKFSFAVAGIALLLLIGMLLRYFETRKHYAVLQAKNDIIQSEQKKSENLLLNILPALVAAELKSNGVAQAKSYEHASVLFTDFIAFSAMAENLSPEELVNILDYYFKGFDDIVSQFNVEKIKTIGDSYMVVSGLPEKDVNNAFEMVRFAIEIQNFMIKSKAARKAEGLPYFDARIGIHTGPLVAGVVGNKKFAYDVWGDTVNVAARVERHGEAGRVNLSSSTYEAVKEQFECEYRGEVAVKNRGDVGMYYLKPTYQNEVA